MGDFGWPLEILPDGYTTCWPTVKRSAPSANKPSQSTSPIVTPKVMLVEPCFLNEFLRPSEFFSARALRVREHRAMLDAHRTI